MSDSRRTLKALHQLALTHLGPSSAALKTREALEAALAPVLAPQAAPPPVLAAVRGFEVRAPLVVKAPFRPLDAPVLPGPFGDDQVLVFPRDAASVMVSWDLSRRGPAVLQVREGGAVLRRIDGLSPMGTLQLDGLGEAHTITVELIQGPRTVGRSKPVTLPGRVARPAEQPRDGAASGDAGAPSSGAPRSTLGAAAEASAEQGAAAGAGAVGAWPARGDGPQGAPLERRPVARAQELSGPESSRAGALEGEPSSSRASAKGEPASSRASAKGEPRASGNKEPASSRASAKNGPAARTSPRR